MGFRPMGEMSPLSNQWHGLSGSHWRPAPPYPPPINAPQQLPTEDAHICPAALGRTTGDDTSTPEGV